MVTDDLEQVAVRGSPPWRDLAQFADLPSHDVRLFHACVVSFEPMNEAGEMPLLARHDQPRRPTVSWQANPDQRRSDDDLPLKLERDGQYVALVHDDT